MAIARALATQPQALLLDEPFTNLDRGTSIYLQREIRAIQQKLGITTVYVTHNQREAEEMGDRIAVMHDGAIEQLSLPEDVFFSPASKHIAEFIGSPNIPAIRTEDLHEVWRKSEAAIWPSLSPTTGRRPGRWPFCHAMSICQKPPSPARTSIDIPAGLIG